MKVGVPGSGTVAKTLAAGLVTHGHDMMIVSRTPVKLPETRATPSRQGCQRAGRGGERRQAAPLKSASTLSGDKSR